MKNLLSRTARLGITLAVSLLFTSIANAQTTSCDTWDYGWTGGPALPGDITYRLDQYCGGTPQDKVITYNDGLVVTVRYVYARGGTGGTANCTNFPKQIVITFSRPIADFQAGVFGARTATDNRGYTINLDPPVDPNSSYAPGRPTREALAFFPGGGITSVTISNPFEYPVYYSDGSLYAQGCWEMWYANVRWNAEPKHNQCNCTSPAISRPAHTFIPPVEAHDVSGVINYTSWSMDVDVTDQDGVTLSNVKLGQRYMAEKISVPYYTLETTAFPKQRGELKPNSTDATMRSRLVNFYITSDADKLVIEATYIIDQIPAGSQSCLHITQRYEFYNRRVGDNCEPSSTLPCARWKPIVKYQFFGQAGETLKSLTIPQRQHLMIDGIANNSVGLFRDSDTIFEVPGNVINRGSFGFASKFNPLFEEWRDYVVVSGKPTFTWDNMHQTYKGIIEEPELRYNPIGILVFGLIKPGCPECLHSHWRWGKISSGNPESGGQLIGIPPGSNQDVAIAVALNQANEEHPTDYVSLVQFGSPIRTYSTSGRNPVQIYRNSAPEDVVFWQVATGYQGSDTFFGYGSFFNPDEPTKLLYQASTAIQDGITSITANHIYTDGNTTITPFDPNQAGPLPTGYTPYNSQTYDIATDAQSAGPYTVALHVPSASDQATFDNLRVFHLEPDPFDSTKTVWVDRTVLAPDPQAPDFASSTISAKANSVGQYAIGLLTQPQPPNTAVADLSITSSDSSDPVVVNNNLTYTLNITNNGPQAATEITLSDALAPNESFVSVSAGQGTCTQEDGTVKCKIGTLSVGASSTVTVVVQTVEGGTALPPSGQTIASIAHVQANENDLNPDNNTVTESTTILPDSNVAPTVSITSPTTGTLFVGPANITLSATASDADGSVGNLYFYGDGNLLGTGTSAGSNQYSFTWNNVSFGTHSLTAIAVDNLGKAKVSDPVGVVVNGSATVTITSPTKWTGAFSRSANIAITANASLSGGNISRVDFYANDILIGAGTLTGTDQYSVTWNSAPAGIYALVAVATDSSGVTTTSSPVNITVNDPPIISLTSPTGGASFTAPANITLTANANDGDGSILQVDFYNNGTLVGTSHTVGTNQFNITLSGLSAGSYSLTAVATDNLGATTTSSPVNITVNAPPSINITSPSGGSVFTPPANITITANASDSDGSVSGVEFYANGNLIGTGTLTSANQYSFTWSNVGYGGYTLTAKATDNSGAVTTSGYINITVNNPPMVSITSPANGSNFGAPATVTINANASDSDGYISKVEFFENSVKVGEDTTAPYSFTWSSVGVGSYSLTAVATDNVGTTATSSPVSITVSPSALFITGSTTLSASDTAIKNRLQTLGYVVTVKTDSSAASTDATGKAVVVISSTVAPNSLSTKFTNVAVPVVIWEPLSFYDMGMTAKGTTNANTATGQTQVKITQPTHALAGGLTGTQTVVTASSTFSWGKPNANAAAVATLVSDATKIIIFGYNKGATMPGLVAPARRVGLFMSDTTAASFNSNGWTLFDAAINWATSPAP